MTDWRTTKDQLPPEGETVETLGQNGTNQRLVRRGNLWFFPDMSMYVYYTPKYWAPIADAMLAEREE